MGCVIFDNSTSNAADVTSWFTNDNPPVESVSLNDNGNEYFCLPAFGIRSNVGVISVAGIY